LKVVNELVIVKNLQTTGLSPVPTHLYQETTPKIIAQNAAKSVWCQKHLFWQQFPS